MSEEANSFTIGSLAKAANVPVETIRISCPLIQSLHEGVGQKESRGNRRLTRTDTVRDV